MTRVQIMKRRELIAEAAQHVREAMAEVDFDRQGELYNKAAVCIHMARKLGCPRFSDEELGVVRLAEEGEL